MDPGNLLFAIPKKGRLYEKCLEIIKGAGLDFRRAHRLDIAPCVNLPVTLVFLPAADIAKYVSQGNIDLGITGQDIVAESEADVSEVLQLGFGKCTVAVQAPVKSAITDVKALVGKRIVTSFPKLTEQFFGKMGAGTQVQFVSGSVEAACELGLADAVVDLVETGTTMRAAGLEKVADVMHTETVLIANPRSSRQETQDLIIQRIKGYLYAQNYLMFQYNVPRTALKAAEEVTPGFTAPTVMPLEDPAWAAVNAMVKSSQQHEVMDKLVALGATGIVSFQIRNSRLS